MNRRLAVPFARAGLAGLAALTLSACVMIPEGETVCPDQGPNTGSWP